MHVLVLQFFHALQTEEDKYVLGNRRAPPLYLGRRRRQKVGRRRPISSVTLRTDLI
jgi:hypothetical protein